MNQHDPKAEGRRRRADRYADPLQAEPSMSAPSPMPGKPAASYVNQQIAAVQPQAEWNPPREPHQSTAGNWHGGQRPVNPGTGGYPVQNYPPPSQGLPPEHPNQHYGAWQQTPVPQQGWQQTYPQPPAQGWNQPVPAQNQEQNGWQGGYTVNQWHGSGYAPVHDQAHVQGGHGGSKGSGGAKPPVNMSALIKILLAVAALAIVVPLSVKMIGHQTQVNALHAEVEAYNDRYCQGVYVDGIHLGGMTKEEARAAVQKNAQLKCDEWHVRLETAAGEYVGEINSYHLGMTVHVDDTLNEAWQQGHTGATVNERKEAMDALLKTPYQGSTALPSGDNTAIDRILNELAANIYLAPVDASAVFDPAKTNPFTITEETVGRELDVEAIKAQVYDMVSRMETGVVLIEPTPIVPNYTKADLERMTTLIGSYYTKISTTSEEDRNKNILRACKLINGTVIEPGQNFSFNGVVGARTKENGFFKAIEYAYGQEREGYGGGVCQVSTTMYIAAVKANLEIVKREQHSDEVGYTTFGLDATVNYDGKKIDFVFKNNTDSPIYIVTKVIKDSRIDRIRDLVYCNIYGPALEEGVSYDLIAVQTEIPIPEPTVVPDRKAEHVIYTDETYTIPGEKGYEVDSYKIKYVNGEEVERTFMYHDTYKVVQPITYVGVSERPLAE